jgi:hypothetical protein
MYTSFANHQHVAMRQVIFNWVQTSTNDQTLRADRPDQTDRLLKRSSAPNANSLVNQWPISDMSRAYKDAKDARQIITAPSTTKLVDPPIIAVYLGRHD